MLHPGRAIARWCALGLTICFMVQMVEFCANALAQDEPSKQKAKSRDKVSPDELPLFVPSKFPKGNWNPTNLRFDDIDFAAEDETKLHGWYVRREKPLAVMLVAHGNAGNVSDRTTWLKYLNEQANLTVFMFDYRGYGRSEGVPTVRGILRDARAARSKLAELAEVCETEIVLMGESLGGAVVIQLASESAPRGLILQSTFSSFQDAAKSLFPDLAWLVPRDKLNSMTAITKYHGPLLQSHGTNDSVIPFALGEKLFDAANEPKQFVPIEGADHNNWMTQEYLREFERFIARLP